MNRKKQRKTTTDVYNGVDVTIRPLETHKDKIKQPKLASKEMNMLIPPLGSSVIISGKSGSGKSTLLANLLLDKRFYKGWFDKIFLFSPTAKGDDIQKQLNIPENHVFTDLQEAPELLELILKSQKEKLEKTTADKAQQYAIIFDDVIGDTKFMNSVSFTQCFYQVRHVCCTTFICTQHFKRVPRVCRLQANFIFYFRGSQSELDTLVEEFAPPNLHKNDFKKLVFNATKGDFSFLTINMKVPWSLRFRQNLGTILHVNEDDDATFSVTRSEEKKDNVLTQNGYTNGKSNAGGNWHKVPGAGKGAHGRSGHPSRRSGYGQSHTLPRPS